MKSSSFCFQSQTKRISPLPRFIGSYWRVRGRWYFCNFLYRPFLLGRISSIEFSDWLLEVIVVLAALSLSKLSKAGKKLILTLIGIFWNFVFTLTTRTYYWLARIASLILILDYHFYSYFRNFHQLGPCARLDDLNPISAVRGRTSFVSYRRFVPFADFGRIYRADLSRSRASISQTLSFDRRI